MNKKAQFIAFLAVFSIIVFSALAYTMYKHDKYQETIKLNIEGYSTFKIYGLAERNKYYLEKAAEISKQKALTELEQNAGHLQGQCSTDLTSGKIIWNSCPKLNLNEDFKILFEKEFKDYIRNQPKLINLQGFEVSLNIEDINKLILKSTNIENNKLFIKFDNFNYNIDFKSQAKELNSYALKYTFDPSFNIDSPDFSVYTQICDVLTNCKLNSQISQNQIDSCISSLKQINSLIITQNNQIIELSYGNLNFLVNLKSEIECQPTTLIV